MRSPRSTSPCAATTSTTTPTGSTPTASCPTARRRCAPGSYVPHGDGRARRPPLPRRGHRDRRGEALPDAAAAPAPTWDLPEQDLDADQRALSRCPPRGCGSPSTRSRALAHRAGCRERHGGLSRGGGAPTSRDWGSTLLKPIVLTRLMLFSARHLPDRTPLDVGLAYSDVEFAAADGVRLRAGSFRAGSAAGPGRRRRARLAVEPVGQRRRRGAVHRPRRRLPPGGAGSARRRHPRAAHGPQQPRRERLALPGDLRAAGVAGRGRRRRLPPGPRRRRPASGSGRWAARWAATPRSTARP